MATFRKTKTGWEAQIARKVAGKSVRKSKTFKTKVLAEQWVAEAEFSLVSGQTSSMTLGDLLRKYEAEVGHKWAYAKLTDNGRLIKCLGQGKVADLNRSGIMAWVADESPYAPSTSEHMLRSLQGALKYAQDAWGMDVPRASVGDALRGLRAQGKLTDTNQRDRRVKPDEEALLVKHWQSDFVSSDVVAFLIDTPMRSGEMCALKWTDIDGQYVTIRDRKDPKKKAGNNQKIKLLGRSVVILAGRKTLAPFPWQQTTVSRAVADAAKAAGMDDLVCHDLRHEGISRLFERGWQIQQVAIISGHKTWKTLQRYTHVSAESLPD
jgi:integrase